MPKRLRSEDEENYSGLLKNHISEREVNTGVLKVSSFITSIFIWCPSRTETHFFLFDLTNL